MYIKMLCGVKALHRFYGHKSGGSIVFTVSVHNIFSAFIIKNIQDGILKTQMRA